MAALDPRFSGTPPMPNDTFIRTRVTNTWYEIVAVRYVVVLLDVLLLIISLSSSGGITVNHLAHGTVSESRVQPYFPNLTQAEPVHS